MGVICPSARGRFFRVEGASNIHCPLSRSTAVVRCPRGKGEGRGERERYANRWKGGGGINKGERRPKKNAALGNARIRGISVEELSRAFPGDSFPLPRFPFIRLESIEKSIVSSETTTALNRLSITALGVPTLFTLTRRKQMNLRLEKQRGKSR